MVGVPRSTGCQLCVKRRVKCDQCQPSCRNCVKYGAPCPGYDRQMKFVAGKHHVRSRRQQDWRGWGSGAAGSQGRIQLHESRHRTSGSPCFLDSSPQGASGTPGSLVFDYASQTQDLVEAMCLYSCPSDDRGQTINAIIHNLHDSQEAGEVRVFAPWFKDVPEHLGQKVTLDGAMAAFALHLLGKAKGDTSLVRESRSIYGQSLGALQKALDHPREWKSSETLCATMILSLYELFAGTVDASSWMKHAAGVSWLLQQRGPEAHRNDWDRSMLVSFRSMIIMHSIFAGQDCFLAQKSWQKLMSEDPVVDDSGDGSVTELYAIADRYWISLARLPAILHRGYALREARRHGLPIESAQITLLVRRAEKLRSEMASLFEAYTALAPAPTEVPSQEPGSIYDTVLSYSNVWHGSFRMSLCATLLILQECLVQCQWPVDYTASNRDLAGTIYRSLECVGAGLMGPMRVGYSLRIAYDFADLRTQMWIGSLLKRFEKLYASTAADGYPKPETNEYQFS